MPGQFLYRNCPDIFLNKCTPHSRYFSDELGVQFF